MTENKDKTEASTPDANPKASSNNPKRNPKKAKKQGKRGPKGRDYDALFKEWVVSGKPKNEWLAERGINGAGGMAYTKTRSWENRMRAMSVGARETAIATDIAKGGTGQTDAVANVIPLPPKPEEVPVGREASDVPVASQPTAWQLVSTWRRKQAAEDWKSADTVRTACKLLLRDAVKKAKDEHGREVYKTTLKAHEIRQIMQCLSDVQRVQRLALGLSTENVGVDMPTPVTEGHVEKPVQPVEDSVPTFIVEMSSRGRFLRPRPRRAQ